MDNNVEIPLNLRQYILSSFVTLTQIEVFCFFQQNRETSFSPDLIRSRLCLSETLIQQTLHKLLEQGMIRKQGSDFQYDSTQAAEVNGLNDQLAHFFQTRQRDLLEMLFQSTLKD